MKHTAKRLIPYAVNGVVHINKIYDPALKRLVKDRRLQPLIRRALKDIGSNYDLLVPYAVDNEEQQLKRYIQFKLGETVNLTELRQNFHNYYLKLCGYGTPAEVIQGWGLGVTYTPVGVTEEEILYQIEQRAVGGVVWKLGRNSKLYQSIAHQARKQGMTVGGYLKKAGYEYRGGNEDARSN